MVDIVDAPAAVDLYAVYVGTDELTGEPLEKEDWLGTIRTPTLASVFKAAIEEYLEMPGGMHLEFREP